MGIIHTRVGNYKPPKKAQRFVPLKPATDPKLEEYRRQMAAMPSVGEGVGNALVTVTSTYADPAMADREAKAKAVRRTVAPICNKGGYQLITDEADLKTVGRKV